MAQRRPLNLEMIQKINASWKIWADLLWAPFRVAARQLERVHEVHIIESATESDGLGALGSAVAPQSPGSQALLLLQARECRTPLRYSTFAAKQKDRPRRPACRWTLAINPTEQIKTGQYRGYLNDSETYEKPCSPEKPICRGYAARFRAPPASPSR